MTDHTKRPSHASRFRISRKIYFLTSLFFVLLINASAFVQAQQQNPVTLMITLPQWMQYVVGDDIVGEFEAQYGVDVVYMPNPYSGFYDPAQDIQRHLSDASQYANSADVLFVDNRQLSAEMTQAGYVLDLMPLVSADAAFDATVYYPAMLSSFQWDNGLWALPVSGTPQILIYDRNVFDEAGLTYPDASWTAQQFFDAVRALTRVDNGVVSRAGFSASGNPSVMIRALLGHGVYGNPPRFTDADVVALLSEWSELYLSSYIDHSFAATPMRLGSVNDLSNPLAEETRLFGSLLPNGQAGLDVGGFAVSARAANPQLAYELVKFLSKHELTASRMFYAVPANQSLPLVENEGISRANLSAETLALETLALASAFPSADLQHFNYLLRAITEPDVALALANAEIAATNNLQTATQRRGVDVVMVGVPLPTAVAGNDEVALRFWRFSTLPQWDSAMSEFVAQDAQVGQITFVNSWDDTVDCGVSMDFPPTSFTNLLDLAPLMSADVNFDRADIFPGVLEMLTVDGVTIGYPLGITPALLMYDPASFESAGLPLPTNDWHVDTFINMLPALRPDNTMPPVLSAGTGNDYLNPLILAAGRMPVDFSTTPPTLNFSDPLTVYGIQRILDLARDGYVEYLPMPNPSESIYTTPGESIMSPADLFLMLAQPPTTTQQVVLYPRGSMLSPLPITPTMGFINRQSIYPEACYRWLSYLSTRPDVLGMPAHISQIDEYAAVSGLGENIVQLYDAMLDRAERPEAVILNSARSEAYSGTFEIQLRTRQAYDEYVLGGAPLENAFADAQADIEAFLACFADIPPLAELALMAESEQVRYDQQYIECVRTHIPVAAWMYGGS